STVTGRCCGVGCAPIEAFPKRNSRSTSVSSNLFTMSESEAKLYFMRSLSCWSHKTLESNMSLLHNMRLLARKAFDGRIGLVDYLGCPAAVVPFVRELAQQPAVRGQRTGAIAAVLLQMSEDEE